MDDTVKGRLVTFLKSKGLSQRRFEQSIGASNGFVNNISKGIGAEKMQKILSVYPEVNPSWLLSGDGDMCTVSEPSPLYATVKSNKKRTNRPALVDVNFGKNEEIVEIKKHGIPYYGELPASAGKLDVMLHDSKPTGYINIPGLRAQALFPVVGCSMKPEINPGDVVGVEVLNNWDSIDPDKVYMIITSDDRMIKHLELDDEDGEILWCVSPNYKRFKIAKSNIKAIYRICYVGKLM